ncbi:hypothetical protein ACFLQ8_00150 [Candidatus Auribacterota bacterium]
MNSVYIKTGPVEITLKTRNNTRLTHLIHGKLKPFILKVPGKDPAVLDIELVRPEIEEDINKADADFLKNHFTRIFSRPPVIKNIHSRIKAAHCEYKFCAGNPLFRSCMKKAVNSPDKWTILDLNSGMLFFNARSKKGVLFMRSNTPLPALKTTLINVTAFISSICGHLNDALLMHGAGIVLSKRGFVFLGRSNAGKTTITKLAGRSNALNDDGIIAGIDRKGCYIMRTPLDQNSKNNTRSASDKYYTNDLFLLIKSGRTRASTCLKKEALTEILNYHIHYLRYFDNHSGKKAFKLAYQIVKRLNCYYLHFNRSREFLDLITSK